MNWFKRGKSETINTRYLNGNLKDHPVFKDHSGTLLFALVRLAIVDIMLGKYEKVSLLRLFYPAEYEEAKGGRLSPLTRIVSSDYMTNAPCGFLLPGNNAFSLDARKIRECEYKELEDGPQARDELFYRDRATREEDYGRVDYKDDFGNWHFKIPLIQRMLGLCHSSSMEKLFLVTVPCIDKDGNIKYVPMRMAYLLHVITSLASKMNLDHYTCVERLVGGNRQLLVGAEIVDPPKLIYVSPAAAMKMLTDSEKFSSSKNGLMSLSAVDDETGLRFQGFVATGVPSLLQLQSSEYFLSYIDTVTAPTYSDEAKQWRTITQLEKYVYQARYQKNLVSDEKPWCRETLQPILSNMQSKIDKRSAI